ncbi:MAG: four helix bundle protein [Verrucomicrobiae bacterium]|nr:four helix bundle protein [Verrucomicrobiae bacterium]
MFGGIYVLTREKLVERDYGLTSQVQRAAVSVMTNIAEGFERNHLQEKLQFYNVARASTGEVRSLLYIIIDNYESLQESAGSLIKHSIAVGKLVTGLINSTRRRT